MRSSLTRHLSALFGEPAPHALLAHAGLAAGPGPRPHGIPQEFTPHDYAVYLLHVAAEIEHVLMVQYLYAAYSLGGPEVPNEKHDEVLKWQNSILGIAKEEMGHFLTVQNVLRLIGGGLNLDREDFPWDVPFYPYKFALEPLARVSLAKYIFAEAPSRFPDDVTDQEKQEIEAAVHMKPEDMPHRVGELYDKMIELLSDPAVVPDSSFREETVPFQASWDEWGRGYNSSRTASQSMFSPNLIIQQVANRTDAVGALTAIARQGEWPEEDPASQELSHFRRFLAIFRQFPAANAEWRPTWEVPINPQAPGIAGSDAGPIIRDPEAALWSILLNIRYRMLLAYLAHSFRLSAEPIQNGTGGPRGMIVNRTFGEMYNLRGIAGILVQLPLNYPADKHKAGPPFQIPYNTKLPFEEVDCWRLHLDLIDASDSVLQQLRYLGKGQRADYAAALISADQGARRQIEVLRGVSLRAMSGSALL
jgi:Ferritin-like